MNHNLIAYLIYLPMAMFITINVGWLFYKNGKVFLMAIFQNNIDLVNYINKVLLLGYYLINIGYSIIIISFWKHLEGWLNIIQSISKNIGMIILILAILHYNNLFWINYITKYNIKINNYGKF